MFLRNLTPRQAHGGEKTYKNVFMMTRNLKIELTQVRDEPYSETYSCR